METNNKVALAWKDFEQCAGETFKSLLADTELADVTLACADDTLLKAHKVILSASSPFFKNLLYKNPHSFPLIYMKGVEGKTLEALLSFIYCGEAKVLEADLKVFLETGTELKIRGLFDTTRNTNETQSHEGDTNEFESETIDKEIEPRIKTKQKQKHAIIEGFTPQLKQQEKRTTTTKPKKHNETEKVAPKTKQQVNPNHVQDKETEKQTVQCQVCNKLLPMDKHVLIKHKKDHRDRQ